MKLTILFFVIAALGVVHHYLVSGRWFDFQALAHHEPIILVFVVLGVWEIIRTKVRG